LNHSTSPFRDGYFWDRVSRAICLGWLWTMLLLWISGRLGFQAWATGTWLEYRVFYAMQVFCHWAIIQPRNRLTLFLFFVFIFVLGSRILLYSPAGLKLMSLLS
jgi:hypothetical protein